MRRTAGSALIAVLWCLVLLALLTIGMLHTTRLDLRLVRNHGDLIQAHYLALAGIEKAKALIYQETEDLQAAGGIWKSNLLDNPQLFRDVSLGRGLYRVVRPSRREEGGRSPIYGLSDEEGRLDLNSASIEELKRLPGMTPEIAAAIADWRDKDDRLTPGGAEAEHYASASPPYRPRNGPFETLRELLMVRGVTPLLLFGEAAGGRLPAGGDGDRSAGGGGRRPDAGWSELLTVDSSVENVNAKGKTRVNLKSAGEETLATVDGITADLAKAIVAYRGQHDLKNLGQLLDVVEIRQNAPGSQPPPDAQPPPVPGGSRRRRGGPPPPVSGPQAEGVTAPAGSSAQPAPPAPGRPSSGVTEGTTKLVSEDLLKRIADEVTTDTANEQGGLVNVNSAPAAVLACLDGLSEELADAIVRHRQSNGPFANVAGLLEVQGMTQEIFKRVCTRIAARPGTYRIISEGKVAATGATKRIEAIVRPGSFDFETLSYREEP